jgi:cell division protein FtsI/penicillin-binding protein 2
LEPLAMSAGFAPTSVMLQNVSPPTDGNREGSTATAELAWRWTFGEPGVLGGETPVWFYTTTAQLRYVPQVRSALITADGQAELPAGWAVEWTPSILVPHLLPGERLWVTRTTADRAEILDSSGSPIIESRPVWRIGIDKSHISAEEWDASARGLVWLVAEIGYEFDADTYAERVAAAGDRAFVDLITVRQASSEVDLQSLVASVPGARALNEMKDLAPTAGFAKTIIGTVGEATAEIIENSNGRIVGGDITGLSGLQKSFNTQLSGTPGIKVSAISAAGEISGSPLFESEAQTGIPLALTLNTQWQKLAEELLANVEPAAAIVAIESSTGAVRVAANGPGSGGMNTAFLGQYPPGSTFKVIDALALKRAGMNSESIVPCPPSITVDGRTFVNVPGYPQAALGDVPIAVAFANSCNTAFISQAATISPDDLVAAATDLGFGLVTPGLGVGAYFGSVPEIPGPTEHAADMLGQGGVTASPLTMARVAASVAAGHRVSPTLLQCMLPAGDVICVNEAPAAPGTAGQAGDEGSPDEETAGPEGQNQLDAAPAAPASALTDAEAQFLEGLMRGVVTEGSATILQDIPGVRGAKTGTAQFGDGSRNHTWMIAIVDDLAVVVFVEDGEFGSTTSGPIMHDFLTAIRGAVG